MTRCSQRMELLKFWKYFGKMHVHELFPTKWSGVIFVAYMALFVNQGLLVTASQTADSGYKYNTVAAVLATEVIKLMISVALFTKDHNVLQLIHEAKTHLRVMYHYFIPASLYCFYNNLAFVNLSVFDPTTYYLLLQLRVVITGVLFQMLFKKQLSTKQWLSLLLLTAGCMIKELPFAPVLSTTDTSVMENDVVARSMKQGLSTILSGNMVLILIQIVCSCLAGVYNELLLKNTDSDTCHIYVQNTFMYLDSIMCNVALLGWQGQLPVLWDTAQLHNLFDLKVLLVILNNAAIGIVTSFFLRSLNSILKTFASALELIFTAFLTWLIFSIPIQLNTLCAISVVSLAVIMYSQNPVVNVRPTRESTHKEVSIV